MIMPRQPALEIELEALHNDLDALEEIVEERDPANPGLDVRGMLRVLDGAVSYMEDRYGHEAVEEERARLKRLREEVG